MRKKIILGLACTMLIGLMSCGHQHTWVEATCEEAKYCQECNETEGEPLGHTWVDASYAAPKTCSVCGKTEGEPLPEPYCEKNHITFEKLENMDLPFAAVLTTGGEAFEHEGVSLEHENANYSFGEITCIPSQQTGYVDVVIPFQVTMSMTYHWDTSKFYAPIGGQITCADFDVGDYYTGLIVPIRDTHAETEDSGTDTAEGVKEYNWNNTAYSINYLKMVEHNREGTGWIGNGNLKERSTSFTFNYTMTITIPEGYDGTVLRIKRAVTEVSFGEDETIDTEDVYLLDEHDADYYFFYRLSDLIG